MPIGLLPFIFDPSICETFDLAQWRSFWSQTITEISSYKQCLRVVFKRIYSNIYSLELESGNGLLFEKLSEWGLTSASFQKKRKVSWDWKKSIVVLCVGKVVVWHRPKRYDCDRAV